MTNRPSVKLPLMNGWTLSFAPDVFAGFWSIAAWPTGDNTKSAAAHRWYEFRPGVTEERITTMEEFAEVSARIGALAQPSPLL